MTCGVKPTYEAAKAHGFDVATVGVPVLAQKGMLDAFERLSVAANHHEIDYLSDILTTWQDGETELAERRLASILEPPE